MTDTAPRLPRPPYSLAALAVEAEMPKAPEARLDAGSFKASEKARVEWQADRAERINAYLEAGDDVCRRLQGVFVDSISNADWHHLRAFLEHHYAEVPTLDSSLAFEHRGRVVKVNL